MLVRLVTAPTRKRTVLDSLLRKTAGQTISTNVCNNGKDLHLKRQLSDMCSISARRRSTSDCRGNSQSVGPVSSPFDSIYSLPYVFAHNSFRKEALKWHPDKNAGSVEASQRFVKIQAAYDVYALQDKHIRCRTDITHRLRLSDDQERAYYDAHRGDIGEGQPSSSHFWQER